MSERQPDATGTPWEPGTTLLDSLVIERRLGRGGMGEVFLVRDTLGGQQFAVKTTLASSLADEAGRRLFFRELQTWIDLPEHPHLVNYRFFRTIAERVAIFAEFVDGLSLQQAIEQGSLDLASALDVAIQMAWGLQAAHDAGVVHQDVKPANVLIALDGEAQIADFGLSRACAASLSQSVAAGDVLVTSSGLTLAYCSPEQAASAPLSSKTDMWSFGLSVLAIFMGRTPCHVGLDAPRVLASFRGDVAPSDQGVGGPATVMATPKAAAELRTEMPTNPWPLAARGSTEAPSTAPVPPGSLELPAEIARILERCFRPDPRERWSSMGEVAELLRRAHEQLLGRPHPRPRPQLVGPKGKAVPLERRVMGAVWQDPREWLAHVARAEGLPGDEIAARGAPGEGSRRAQAIDDLALYDEAARRLERLIEDGNDEHAVALSRLYEAKGLVHIVAEDFSGEVTCGEKQVTLLERLVQQRGRGDLAGALANAYMGWGNSIYEFGERHDAIAIYDKAIALAERHLRGEARTDLISARIRAYLAKADVYNDLEDHELSTALCDKAIAALERLTLQKDRGELLEDLYHAYQLKGDNVLAVDEPEEAFELYQRSLSIDDRLDRKGRPDLEANRAMTVGRMANALAAGDNPEESIPLHDQAIATLERLVIEGGYREYIGDLADLYTDKAETLWDLEEEGGAISLYDKAIELRERLVNQEGLQELAAPLAALYRLKAERLADQGDARAAIALLDRTIDIYAWLFDRKGWGAMATDLAFAYGDKADALLAEEEAEGALEFYDKALVIFEQMVQHEGRDDMAGALASICVGKGDASLALERNDDASAFYDEAIAVYERLVRDDEHDELLGELAGAYTAKAGAVEDDQAAIDLLGKAIELRETLVEQGEAGALADLAENKLDRALMLADVGRRTEARAEAKEVIAMLEEEAARSPGPEAREQLSEARKELAFLLGRRST
jgi:serine/threonine protein kinase/tetratricopeptide (TPR) repeat protein